MSNNNPEPEALLTPKEAAAYLRLSSFTLGQYTRAGKVPAVRVGWFWRYRLSELDAFLRGTTNQPAQEQTDGR